MQVAKPLSMLWVGEMREAPVMHLLVPPGVFGIPGDVPGQMRGDDGFIVRPPELHEMPVL